MSTETQVRRYNDYLECILPGYGDFDALDKKQLTRTIINTMINRSLSMFAWQGLPDTIPQRMLELYLQTYGYCGFYYYKDGLYIYRGGLGGESDVYYQPTILTIANPAQELSVNAVIDRDCVVMRNDSLLMGLLPIHKRYASSMAETEISMYDANINTRIISLISAQDDRTRKSAEVYLERVKNGEVGIISETKFFDDLKVSPFSTSSAHAVITDLIELMQYNKASWFNEIGLNANYNMKRESINSGESQLNNDALSPLVDDMLRQRQEGAEKVNAMFGTNITVNYASAWEDNEKEIEAEQKALEGGENGAEGKIPDTGLETE